MNKQLTFSSAAVMVEVPPEGSTAPPGVYSHSRIMLNIFSTASVVLIDRVLYYRWYSWCTMYWSTRRQHCPSWGIQSLRHHAENIQYCQCCTNRQCIVLIDGQLVYNILVHQKAALPLLGYIVTPASCSIYIQYCQCCTNRYTEQHNLVKNFYRRKNTLQLCRLLYPSLNKLH